jgi:GT2 family glycosyltransferase
MNVGSSQDVACSVCIANYNGVNVLEACLDSVFRQDFPHSIEVIVHDDASTDGSAAIVTEKYQAVRLLRSKTNVGFCVSNNRMVAVAKGKFILLLNNDAELRGDALSVLYDYAVRTNVCGIVGLPQYSKETGELLDMGSRFDPFLNPIPNLNDSRRNVGMVIGACMWLPKQLWNELGGFPEWFESLAEDMYLCCCARLKGYPVIALAASGFDHWVGSNLGGGKVIRRTLQTTYRRRTLSERNKSYVMFLCYPAPLAHVLIPLHLLSLAMEGLVLSAVKKEWRIWIEIYRPCFSALWRNRNKLMRLRREIQAGRRVSLISFYSVHTFLPHKLTMLIKYGLPTLK